MSTVSFRAKRGSSQELFDRTNDNPRSFIVRATVFDTGIAKPTIARSLVVCATRDDRSQCPAKVLEAVQTFFDHVEAGGVAEPDSPVVAEGSSRNYGDAGFTKQTVGEILRSQPQLADVHQDVKCALRFDRSDVRDLREAVEHVIATH